MATIQIREIPEDAYELIRKRARSSGRSIQSYMRDVVIDYVEDLQQSGFRIGNPNPVWTDPQALAIQELLDTQINPAVASHGGHIELVDVHDNIVYIRFGGGCQGCGMVSVTLNQGVEQAIREAFPAIREIVDVTDHAAGTNPYYQSSKG